MITSTCDKLKSVFDDVMSKPVRYSIEYRLSNRHKWRKLSVSQKVPFTKADHEKYGHMLADRHHVSWLSVQLRMVQS